MAKTLSLLLLALALLSGAAPAGARPVTDAMGRVVEVPEPQNVRRVIALGSSMAFVTYLGAQDRIVGVEDIEAGRYASFSDAASLRAHISAIGKRVLSSQR